MPSARATLENTPRRNNNTLADHEPDFGIRGTTLKRYAPCEYIFIVHAHKKSAPAHHLCRPPCYWDKVDLEITQFQRRQAIQIQFLGDIQLGSFIDNRLNFQRTADPLYRRWMSGEEAAPGHDVLILAQGPITTVPVQTVIGRDDGVDQRKVGHGVRHAQGVTADPPAVRRGPQAVVVDIAIVRAEGRLQDPRDLAAGAVVERLHPDPGTAVAVHRKRHAPRL